MKKNKIAGLLVASALVVGATGATHAHADTANNHKTNNIKGNTNKILLADSTHSMTKNAVVVNGNGDLSLRSSADSQSQIVSNISVGEMLNIQSYSSNWYKVTVKETGATGFISSANLRYIESGLNSKFVDLNNNGQVINVSSDVNVRSEATINSNISTTLSNGTQLKIVGKQGQWYKVIANGVSGFVYGEYVSMGNEISPSAAPATVSATNTVNKTNNINNTTTDQSSVSTAASVANTASASKKTETTSVAKTTETTNSSTQTTETTSTSTQIQENSNTQKDNLNVKPSKVNKVDSHSTPVSFLAIPSVNTNTQSKSTNNQATATGSITLTIYQTNTDRALANQNITIDGQSYTTNAQGKVKIADLNAGSHKINIAAQGFNNTSAITNIKSGKNMNKIVYLTADSNASQANNNSNSNSNASQANNNSNSNSNASQANNNSNSNSNASQANNNSNSNSNASQANNNSNSNSNASQANNNSNSTSNASQANNNSNSNSNASQANNNSNSNSNAGQANNNSNSNSNANQGNSNSNIGQSTSQLQQSIVQYAKSFLGRPYIWGATGPNAFDCSGLTYYVYKHFGYYIGCTTYTQIDQGTPVSLNNLQPGDLIFWGDPSAPYHVAIYIGNGQYIQAPKPGETVDISSWNLSNVSAARRIV